MDRNKHVTTSLTLPALTHTTEQTGYFSAGDVNLGTQPTVPTADWCNGITEEIRNVIVSAGITPSRSDLTQLQQAIGLNAVKPNLLDNPSFKLWQRGTSLPAGTGIRFAADRWAVDSVGETIAVTQGVFTPGQTVVVGNPQYYHSATIASTANAANYALISQKVLNASQSAGGTITVGFKAKLSTPGSIALELSQNFGIGGSNQVDIAPVTIALTSSWGFYTATFTVPSVTGKTFALDDVHSLYLKFWVSAGSAYTTRTNTLGQKSVTFDLAQVQMVDGSNMASWVEPNYLTEKIKALQFYEKGVFEGCSTSGGATTSYYLSNWVSFAAPKYRIPVITQINNLTRYFVLKSGTNTVGQSPDGINYVTKTLPISAAWTCIAASPVSHIAVMLANGTANYVTTSDGITWTARTMPSSQNWSCISVHPTTGVFVAVAYGSNVFATSGDGITWTSRTLPSVSNWTAIEYCLTSDLWFVTSATAQLTGVSIANTTFTATTSASMLMSQPYSYILSVFSNYLLAITGTSTGVGANLSLSTTGGASWVTPTNGLVTTGNITGAASIYGGVTVVIVGGVVKYSNSIPSATSTWSTAITVPTGHTWVNVVANGNAFIMHSPTTGGFATSTDGNTWTIASLTGATGGTAFGAGNVSFSTIVPVSKGLVSTSGYSSTRAIGSASVCLQWSEQWTADAEI